LPGPSAVTGSLDELLAAEFRGLPARGEAAPGADELNCQQRVGLA
jgi:hypothetical protein